MTWLKKIGSIVAKVVGVAVGFVPLIQGVTKGTAAEHTVAAVSDDLTKIFGAVTTVEAVFAAISDPNAKTGPEKLIAARALVSQVVQQSEIMVGKKIKDEAKFIAACEQITSGAADLLNSLE